MDPGTILAACTAVLGTVKFVMNCIENMQNTDKEIAALHAELAAIELSLRNDGRELVDNYPVHLRPDLENIILRCKAAVEEIKDLMETVTTSIPGQIQWQFSQRDQMIRLRKNLEGHKSAIMIATAFSTMSATSNIKNETAEIIRQLSCLPDIQKRVRSLPDLHTKLTAVLEAIEQQNADSYASRACPTQSASEPVYTKCANCLVFVEANEAAQMAHYCENEAFIPTNNSFWTHETTRLRTERRHMRFGILSGPIRRETLHVLESELYNTLGLFNYEAKRAFNRPIDDRIERSNGSASTDRLRLALDLEESGYTTYATAELRSLAGAGNVWALILYALALRDGRGCRVDEQATFFYLLRAVRISIELELRSSSSGPYFSSSTQDAFKIALLELGNCFYYGWGCPPSTSAARFCYAAAADLGCSDAIRKLARTYLTRRSSSQDKFTAAQLLRYMEREGQMTTREAWIWEARYDPLAGYRFPSILTARSPSSLFDGL